MKIKMRNCVKKLEKGEAVEQSLQEYATLLSEANGKYARIKMAMEYYMFYEMISEKRQFGTDSVKEVADSLHCIIAEFYQKKPSREANSRMADRLLALRDQVIDRMNVLTAYVDCFVIYEYILNRIQYRFEEREMLPDDTAFTRELVQFIFSSQDNVIINDNIRFVLGQLPVRMSRSRYYDLIRENISAYKGSDVNSLESFLYMFRTNAMLYRNEHMTEYFTEFAPVIEELAAVDYENADRETYTVYAEKIRTNASKLNDISDLYMQLGTLINDMYIICVTDKDNKPEERIKAADTIIREINALFCQRKSDDCRQTEEAPETAEQKLYQLGEKLTQLEGAQEKLYESLNAANAVLEQTAQGYQEKISAMGLTEDFVMLQRLLLLTSDSIFANLTEDTEERKVTEQMVEQETEKLLTECKTMFQGKSRMLRRAIMANTLEKLPVFFDSAQEVADYITASLSQCSDEAEKYAAKQLLLEIMP